MGTLDSAVHHRYRPTIWQLSSHILLIPNSDLYQKCIRVLLYTSAYIQWLDIRYTCSCITSAIVIHLPVSCNSVALLP